MDISYLGNGSVRISGKDIDIVTDPVAGTKVKADVVTWSAPEASGMGFVKLADTLLLDDPGEYEVKSCAITGVPTRLHIDESGERGTAYSFDVDGIHVIVVGNVAGKLADAQVEGLGQADVLVVPVGGGGLTLDAQGAAELVAQLEPSWVIPVHYDDGVSQYAVPQAKVDEFLGEMGVKPEPVSKFRLSTKDTAAETQVVLLQRQGS